MNDASTGEPRFDETPIAATRQVAAGDWNRAEIESQPYPSPPRERLFSRKVMIGWALFAIAAYFGVQVAKSAVKASVRQAVESGALTSATQTKGGIVIETPSGTRVTIGRKRPGPPVEVIRTEPAPTATTRPTTRTTAEPPTPTTADEAASKADPSPSAVPSAPKKR